MSDEKTVDADFLARWISGSRPLRECEAERKRLAEAAADIQRVMANLVAIVASGREWKSCFATLEQVHFAGWCLVRLGLMTRADLRELVRPVAKEVDAEACFCGPDDDWTYDLPAKVPPA